MRVTNQGQMLANIRELDQLTTSIFKLEEQASSGKVFTKPSDDPVSFSQDALDQHQLSQLGQWTRNVTAGQRRLSAADQALQDIQTTVSKIKELALQANNTTLNASDLKDIAAQARQLHRHLLEVANTQVDGIRIFAGYLSDKDPFALGAGDTVAYLGDTNPVSIETGQNQTLQVSVPGNEIFQADPTQVSTPKATSQLGLHVNFNTGDSPVGPAAVLTGSGASSTTSSPGNLSLQVNLNGDGPQTVTVAAGLSGSALAAALQSAVRALTPVTASNAGAYQGFTATVNGNQQFVLTSGQAGPGSAVTVSANGADTLASTLDLLQTGGNANGVNASTTPGATGFSLGNPSGTSNFSVQATVDDSTGAARVLSVFFTKVGPHTWTYNVTANSSDVTLSSYNPANINSTNGTVRVASGTIGFSTSGAVSSESPATRYNDGTVGGTLGIGPGPIQVDFAGAAPAQALTLSFGASGSAESGTPDALVSQTQDGIPAGAPTTANVFATISSLLGALEAPTRQSLTTAVGQLDAANTQISGALAKVGALADHLNTRSAQISEEQTRLQATIDTRANVDFPAVMSSLTQAQLAQQAAAKGQSVLQSDSLLNYLR